MRTLTNQEVTQICSQHQYLNDARIAVAEAAGINGSNATWEDDADLVNNSQTGMCHRILHLTMSEKYALTGKEEVVRYFIPYKQNGREVDMSRADWGRGDFSLGKPAYGEWHE